MEKFLHVSDIDENTPMLGSMKESQLKKDDMEPILEYFRTHRSSLKNLGLKAIVTDYSLAHWFAQSCMLDIHNMPISANESTKHLKQDLPQDEKQ